MMKYITDDKPFCLNRLYCGILFFVCKRKTFNDLYEKIRSRTKNWWEKTKNIQYIKMIKNLYL